MARMRRQLLLLPATAGVICGVAVECRMRSDQPLAAACGGGGGWGGGAGGAAALGAATGPMPRLSRCRPLVMTTCQPSWR